jgi:cold shock protein
MEGIIKKLNEKGFGFITPEGEDKDVFFHRNDLVDADFDNLSEGQSVTFDKEDSEKGPKAVNVTLVE